MSKQHSVVETFDNVALARSFGRLVLIHMQHLDLNQSAVRKNDEPGDEWNVLGFRLTEHDACVMRALAEGFRCGYCFAMTGALY